jgi:hypothetical protein
MDHALQNLASYEIQTVLEKASLFGGAVAQPSATKKWQSVISRIDVDSSGVLLITLRDKVELERDRPVAIRLNYRNVSFSLSSQDYSVLGATLIGQIPREAKAIAIRDTERYVLPLDTKVNTGIYRIEKRGCSLDIEARMVDVSKQGLGLLLTNTEADTLIPNDHIWVKKIKGLLLEVPIFGRVVYLNQRRYKDSMDIRCGFSLESKLPEETFRELRQMCRLILKA